jgi:hypothetical protein
MKTFLLAGILLLLAAPPYVGTRIGGHRAEDDTPAHVVVDSLPDAMMGSWNMGDEEGIMDRAGPDGGDFFVEKDKYSGVDDVCTILHVEKLSAYVYTVQARCAYDGDDPLIKPRIETDEFELVGKDKLRVSPVGS